MQRHAVDVGASAATASAAGEGVICQVVQCASAIGLHNCGLHHSCSMQSGCCWWAIWLLRCTATAMAMAIGDALSTTVQVVLALTIDDL